MDIKCIGTVKKYRNSVTEWYSLLIRQYNQIHYVNVYWKEGEPIPTQDHKVHIKGRGKLFKDKRTQVTRFSIMDAEVLEDLGIDELELIEQQAKEISLVASDQKFDVVGVGDDVLPWEE